jgi:hypothetical protein
VQQVRLEAQKGDDLRPHARAHGPLAPVVQVGFEFEMDKTIAQRPRHREMHATLRGRIAGGDDHPPVGQHVLAQFAVEHQLVAAGLRHLRRRGQLIEKENAFPSVGRNLGGTHSVWSALIRGSPRRSTGSSCTARTSRKLEVEIVRDLGDDLRLADAARAPDMQRHTFADQRMKRLVKLGWFH